MLCLFPCTTQGRRPWKEILERMKRSRAQTDEGPRMNRGGKLKDRRGRRSDGRKAKAKYNKRKSEKSANFHLQKLTSTTTSTSKIRSPSRKKAQDTGSPSLLPIARRPSGRIGPPRRISSPCKRGRRQPRRSRGRRGRALWKECNDDIQGALLARWPVFNSCRSLVGSLQA